MVSALASSSLGVPRWEASDVLRLLVRDWDLLKQKGEGGWGATGPGTPVVAACLEAGWVNPVITRMR